jgi:hypothetical protein
MRGIEILYVSSMRSPCVLQRSDAARVLMNLDRKTKFSFLFYSFFSEVIICFCFSVLLNDFPDFENNCRFRSQFFDMQKRRNCAPRFLPFPLFVKWLSATGG